MIDRLSLAALSPQQRADVIYSEAQSALAQRLWQAALGDRADDRTPLPGIAAGGAGVQQGGLDALLASLTRGIQPDAPVPHAPPASAAAIDPAEAATPTGTSPLEGLGPNACHADTLLAAADRTGVPASALAAIVDAEAAKGRDGSWQLLSRNPRSSAAGLGQFLSGTWQGLAETSGTWLNGQCRARGWLDEAGHVRADARAPLLAMRYDASAAINGIADYAHRNLTGLERAGVHVEGDVRATARVAYLGHHLGLGDAIRFLRDGGLGEARARRLLDAQVGTASSGQRIAASGDATAAHRDWLLGYLDRKIRPGRFAGET